MTVQLPGRDEVVIRYLLERNAAEAPDDVFIRFDTGAQWTRQEAVHIAYGAAQKLRTAGIRQGDRVALFLPNGEGFLRAWWGAHALGATVVPLGFALRGETLAHPLRLTAPTAIVTDDERIPLLDATDVQAPRILVDDLNVTSTQAPPLDRPIEPWDVHSIVFTSGTTGLPKGSITSNFQLMQTGWWCHGSWDIDAEDVFLINLPLFHTAAQCMVAASLRARTRMAVDLVPKMSNYWEHAKEMGVTVAHLIGSMAGFLMSQPEREADRDHGVRLLIASPMPPDADAFMNRFGVAELLCSYGSTETPGPIVRAPGQPIVPGAIGRQRAGFECRLVDEFDQTVVQGEVGELIVRTDLPWSQTGGYIDNPESTVKAWRNGWFHTGDLMRQDEAGNFFFHDRETDSLRRRGENISSLEVESELLAVDGVVEVACVGVPSPDPSGDVEVKVFLVVAQGTKLDFEHLVPHLAERMPYYMVPRLYEVVAELPKTPTNRVLKKELRSRPSTEATWDAVLHGFRLTRNGIVRDTDTASAGGGR